MDYEITSKEEIDNPQATDDGFDLDAAIANDDFVLVVHDSEACTWFKLYIDDHCVLNHSVHSVMDGLDKEEEAWRILTDKAAKLSRLLSDSLIRLEGSFEQCVAEDEHQVLYERKKTFGNGKMIAHDLKVPYRSVRERYGVKQ